MNPLKNSIDCSDPWSFQGTNSLIDVFENRDRRKKRTEGRWKEGGRKRQREINGGNKGMRRSEKLRWTDASVISTRTMFFPLP